MTTDNTVDKKVNDIVFRFFEITDEFLEGSVESSDNDDSYERAKNKQIALATELQAILDEQSVRRQEMNDELIEKIRELLPQHDGWNQHANIYSHSDGTDSDFSAILRSRGEHIVTMHHDSYGAEGGYATFYERGCTATGVSDEHNDWILAVCDELYEENV